MRILVTGAGGFLGRVLSAQLRDAGHEVWTLGRRGGHGSDRERTLVADLRDLTATTAALDGLELDGVCHLAALTRVRDSFADPAGYYATNVGGTANLLTALAPLQQADRPLRFVLASTCAIYGPVDRPADEDTPPAPGNPYARSKLAAEQLLAAQADLGGLAAVTLRCFNTAGGADGVHDTDLTRLIPMAAAVAAGFRPVFTLNGDGSAVREFTHVLDLADAFALALEHARPGQHDLFNVGSGRGVALREVLAEVERIAGHPLPINRRPAQNEPHALVADSTRIREQLGWQPTRSDLPQIVGDAWNAITRHPGISGVSLLATT